MRPYTWLWFETGSVWFTEKQILPVLAGGLRVADVPYPMSARQIQDLGLTSGVKQLFLELGVTLSDEDATQLVEHFRSVGKRGAIDSWKTFNFEDRQFVWDGPVARLADRSEVIATRELMAALEAEGFKSRCASGEMLGKHSSKGYRQVFESDLRNWKRPVKCPDTSTHYWMVLPSER